MNKEHKTLDVVGAIILRERKLFATQRGYGDYAGWWEFPGGKIDPGETPEAALIREIREELDANILIDRYFDTTEYDYPEFHLSMRCYLCRLAANTEISLLEHRSALWVSRENIYSVRWLCADLPIIESLIKQNIL